MSQLLARGIDLAQTGQDKLRSKVDGSSKQYINRVSCSRKPHAEGLLHLDQQSLLSTESAKRRVYDAAV